LQQKVEWGQFRKAGILDFGGVKRREFPKFINPFSPGTTVFVPFDPAILLYFDT